MGCLCVLGLVLINTISHCINKMLLEFSLTILSAISIMRHQQQQQSTRVVKYTHSASPERVTEKCKTGLGYFYDLGIGASQVS